MKITRKQIEEWNKKCGNGFKVNERQAIMWGQKRLYKYIRLSPEYLLEVSRREKGDLLSSTFDMEYEVRLQEDRKRKNFNDLLKLSNADDGLKDEQLLQRYMNHFKKEKEI